MDSTGHEQEMGYRLFECPYVRWGSRSNLYLTQEKSLKKTDTYSWVAPFLEMRDRNVQGAKKLTGTKRC